MIIAEIGQNHCGNMKLARELIRLAEENGADLVKFQLYDHNILYNSNILNVELSFDQAKMLFDFGAKIGIEVFFSVFDVERVKWCEEIGVKRYKIATRKPHGVVEAVRETGKPAIISLGLQHDFWRGVCRDAFNSRGRYLYCPEGYPAYNTRFEEIYFTDTRKPTTAYYPFDGLSDHFIGIDVAKIALARGAQIIEKHFAIDHKTGVDAEWSMDYNELRELKRWEEICTQEL